MMKGLRIMQMRHWGVRYVLTLAFAGAIMVAYTAGATAQLEIASEQMFLIGSEQGPDIHVLHLLNIRNIGADVVPEVELPVPLQATEIVAENVPDNSLWLEAVRVADQRPLESGELRHYELRYRIPVGTVPVVLQRNMPYPVDLISLWLDAGHFRITGVGPGEGPWGAPTLRAADTVAGVDFDIYEMEGVPVVDPWQVVIEPLDRRATMKPLNNPLIHGDPGVFFAEIRDQLTPWVFPWGLSAVVLGLAAFVVWRQRGSKVAGPKESRVVRELKNTLIDLDMRFRREELDEVAYRDMRTNLKEEVLSVLERDARRVGRSGRDEVEVNDGV